MPDLHTAVSAACYHYSVSPNETEGFCHQIVVLLMEDDYRRLRSFHAKSSSKTWLTAIALHYVSNHVSRQMRGISLDEISPEVLVCQPTQESGLISLAARGQLNDTVKQLSVRERKLFELLCRDDMTSADVAREMGIKIDSVRRRKHALIKKLRETINPPRSPKTKRHPKNK